ncbi:MAG: hypothetical protein HKN16_07520 [Saprospiraceae bacterium]|nr:hypothetical protein [Saprospiraceae bacterium]
MHKIHLLTFLILGTLTVQQACVQPEDYPIEPVITFESISKSQMIQGNAFQDTTTVVLSFTDGDGDIGTEGNDINLSMIDSRTGLESQFFSLPFVPNPNEKYGISGEIYLQVYTVCCINPELNEICDQWEDFPVDELTYEITLTDRAGNVSNSITTSPIQILCN